MKDPLVDPWMQSLSDHHAEFPRLLVVDALDEIEDRDELTFVDEITYKSHLQVIKFLITSRPDMDTICASHDVPTNTVKADISTCRQSSLNSGA